MLKLKHIGGERVKGGNYWNFSTGERITIESGKVLPGDSSVTYYNAHPAVILLASPILGLVYATFLPFIGIAVLVKVVGTKLFGGIIGEYPALQRSIGGRRGIPCRQKA